MKILLLFLFATTSISYGQVIDSAIYRCTYTVKTIKDTTDIRFFTEDIMSLDIGKNVNHFYSQRKLQRDSIIQSAVEAGSLNMSVIQSAPKGINKYEIYQNYPFGKETFTNELAGRRTMYTYEEERLSPNWEIQPNKKDILGYSCQSAICYYRGRNYIAWFTTELPLPFGPWKFGGLPGLILKISDINEHYIFEAIGFEKLEVSSPIVLNTSGYQKISRENYIKIEKSFLEDPIAWINQNTGVTIQGLETPQAKQREGIRENKYASIELE